jgi:hypothetical protein
MMWWLSRMERLQQGRLDSFCSREASEGNDHGQRNSWLSADEDFTAFCRAPLGDVSNVVPALSSRQTGCKDVKVTYTYWSTPVYHVQKTLRIDIKSIHELIIIVDTAVHEATKNFVACRMSVLSSLLRLFQLRSQRPQRRLSNLQFPRAQLRSPIRLLSPDPCLKHHAQGPKQRA